MAKLLLIEDNVEEATILANLLKRDGNVVDMMHSAEDALQVLGHYEYDLLIVDWHLGAMTGAELCKTYRARGGRAMILMLTGRSDIDSKEKGFHSGADDYLTKPYDVREAVVRIHALMRRANPIVSAVLTVGDVELDVATHTLKVKSQEVQLSGREVALMEHFMRHQNQYFSSKALLNSVWPLESAMSEDTVRSCVRHLRNKLAEAGSADIVQTVQGLGYGIWTDKDKSKA
jgi:DNA-binding response OmpR family regulator